MSNDSASGRQASISRSEALRLLGDEKWLQRRYDLDGDKKIGAYLGVSHETVRRYRMQLGIVSRPRGGQVGVRGRDYRIMHVRPVKTAAMQISGRLAEETGSAGISDGPPATLSLVAARVRSLHEANAAHDQPAIKDALISLASACGLVLNHLQRLEAA